MRRKNYAPVDENCHLTHLPYVAVGENAHWCTKHVAYVHICDVCGLEFHSRRAMGVKTCSDACRKALTRRKV